MAQIPHQIINEDRDLPKTRKEAIAIGSRWYFDGKPCKYGHIVRKITRTYRCRQCELEARRKWRKGWEERTGRSPWQEYRSRHPEQFIDDHCREFHRRVKRNNPIRSIINMAKQRARKRRFEFDLADGDFTIPEHCPACGIELIIGASLSERDRSVSLDRIDSDKGYIRGNVAVICFKCNMIKSNASAMHLKNLAGWYEASLMPVSRIQAMGG